MDALLEMAKIDDLNVIMDVLQERNRKFGEPITLAAASLVLFAGLHRKPAAWTISIDEMPELWPEYVREYWPVLEAA